MHVPQPQHLRMTAKVMCLRKPIKRRRIGTSPVQRGTIAAPAPGVYASPDDCYPEKHTSMQVKSAPTIDLIGVLPEDAGVALTEHFAARGQPGYRVKQVLGWLYERGVESFEEMTNLPAEEREALAAAFDLTELEAA